MRVKSLLAEKRSWQYETATTKKSGYDREEQKKVEALARFEFRRKEKRTRCVFACSARRAAESPVETSARIKTASACGAATRVGERAPDETKRAARARSKMTADRPATPHDCRSLLCWRKKQREHET